MKKYLSILFLVLITLSCNEKQTIDPVIDPVRNDAMDDLISSMHNFYKHIINVDNETFVENLDIYKEKIKSNTLSEDEAYTILYKQLGFTSDSLTIFIQKINSHSEIIEKQSVELSKRYESHLKNGIIPIDDPKLELRIKRNGKGCSFWQVARGVVKSTSTIILGCSGGPLGCALGGVVAAIEVYELSEKIVNHDC